MRASARGRIWLGACCSLLVATGLLLGAWRADYFEDSDVPAEALFLNTDDCHMSVHPKALTVPALRRAPSMRMCTVLSVEMLKDPALGPAMHALDIRNPQWRKEFELSHLVWALDKLGVLTPDAEGLAVAAGHERTMYYLSSRVKMLYAGDMYGVGEFAADGTSTADIVRDPGKFAPPGVAWDPAHLKVIWQDARDLSMFKDGTLDFVYSLSSIEHFGGRDAVQGAAASMWEQARVVKPGGVVYVAVDLLLTGNGEMPGNGFNSSQIQEAIIHPAEVSGLKLVEPVQWGITRKTLQGAVFLGVFGDKHICLEHPQSMYCQRNPEWYPAQTPLRYRCGTSLILVFRKQ